MPVYQYEVADRKGSVSRGTAEAAEQALGVLFLKYGRDDELQAAKGEQGWLSHARR